MGSVERGGEQQSWSRRKAAPSAGSEAARVDLILKQSDLLYNLLIYFEDRNPDQLSPVTQAHSRAYLRDNQNRGAQRCRYE